MTREDQSASLIIRFGAAQATNRKIGRLATNLPAMESFDSSLLIVSVGPHKGVTRIPGRKYRPGQMGT